MPSTLQPRNEPAADPQEAARPVPDAELGRILGMLVEQRPLGDILGGLCRYLSEEAGGGETAIFQLEVDQWWLAATSRLAARSRLTIARIEPAALSDVLWGPEAPPFNGWARHLCSGAGELLGLIVGLADGPAAPCGAYASRLETAVRLAVLAIEQRHLIGELDGGDAPESPAGLAVFEAEREAIVQRVARMIGHQAPPEKILPVLSGYLAPAGEARQLAFYIANGEGWRMVAGGVLTPRSTAALAGIDPAEVSASLFTREPAAPGKCGCAIDTGWAGHLRTGSGELLGMVVAVADGPMSPYGIYWARLRSVCCLASLAIEQGNLIEELSYQACHDPLTGLTNRQAYERELTAALREARQPDRPVVLFRINLNRFRRVNEILGPQVGNRVLERAGRCFQSIVRPRDTVARVGGDDFAIVLRGVENTETCDALAVRIHEALATPFTIEGNELYITARIGIARSTPGSTAESLEREASLALAGARHPGRAHTRHFNPSMAAAPPERLEVERRLRFAVERKELVLHYQPQMDLASQVVCGAEALLRWCPDGMGIVSPAAFIPILEETGLIVEVGRWVLREACRQGKEWMDCAGLRLRLGVNVSAVQFAQPDFATDVRLALLDTGFPPELLELELTESLFVGDFSAAREVFQKLQRAGVALSLDDFGTGQSALSYLRELPFQRLKIDQSFVRGIREDDITPPLLQNIVRMAEELGMSTIAEGIETAHQARILRSLGCREGQGYLFARPLPPVEAFDFYLRHTRAIA